jgi:hypothetical protein
MHSFEANSMLMHSFEEKSAIFLPQDERFPLQARKTQEYT